MIQDKRCPHCGTMLDVSKQLSIDIYNNQIRNHEPVVNRKTLELLTGTPNNENKPSITKEPL